jgi:PAP2 superfamily
MSEIQLHPVLAPLQPVGVVARAVSQQMFPGLGLWLAAAAILAVDCLWLRLDPRLDADPLLIAGCALAGFAALTFASTIAMFGIPRNVLLKRVYQLIMIALLGLTAQPALFIFNHLVMSLKLPFADGLLIAADRAVGFDWLAYASFIAAHPWLAALLLVAYNSIHGVVAVCAAGLIVIGRHQRAAEFSGLLLVTALGGSLIGIFFPAMAAMAMLGTSELIAQLPPMAGRAFIEPLLAMRSADMLMLDQSNLTGITALPSYHATLGVLCVYSCRGIRWALPSMSLYVFVMLASTPIYGGHYLADLASALLFTGFAIWAWRGGLEDRLVPHRRGNASDA